MFSIQDEHYMRRCFTLALNGLATVKTNPMVGSIVVHDGQIIAEGYHEFFGGYHAERNALVNVPSQYEHLLPESTLYVSLEPCQHTGKTPPCTQIIIEKKIKKVIVCQMDPNPLMQGKSIAYLRERGVDVRIGLLEKEGRLLNRTFIVNQHQKIPFIILKYALSKEGFLGKEGEQKWLSNHESKILVHKWRSEIDAIMIGTNTAIVDNPKLTTREWYGTSPLRIIIDKMGRIPKTAQMCSDDLPTLIYTTLNDYDAPGINKTIQLLPVDTEDTLHWVLQDLYQRGIANLMVEGGALMLQSFVTKELWHEARIIQTNTSIDNGIRSPLLQGIKEKEYILGDNKALKIRSILLDHLLFG